MRRFKSCPHPREWGRREGGVAQLLEQGTQIC